MQRSTSNRGHNGAETLKAFRAVQVHQNDESNSKVGSEVGSAHTELCRCTKAATAGGIEGRGVVCTALKVPGMDVINSFMAVNGLNASCQLCDPRLL